jgi:hypothetical protein
MTLKDFRCDGHEKTNIGVRGALRPGVNVMIVILSDFLQFSAKILAFFLKTKVIFLSKLNSILSKKANVLPIVLLKMLTMGQSLLEKKYC